MALITLLRRWAGAEGRRTAMTAGRAGHLRRRTVLRRQHDHPGDLGAVRGRGPQGRRPGARGAGRADHRGDHRGAVRGAAPRHRRRRPVVRTGDDRLVRRDRRLRGGRHRRTIRDILRALSPTYALAFIAGHFHIAFFALAAIVLAVTGAEALYADMGHFGRKAITLRLAVPGAARVHAELLRPGRAGARRRESWCSAPFFLLAPDWGADPDGAAGDGGDGDRVAGRDHRRILGRVAGRAARLPAAAADRTHLGVDDRPDLRAVDQRHADGRRC